MLYLISIGLADEKDMSQRAIEAARKCNILYAEFYTTSLSTNTNKLSKLIGKNVNEISRRDLEEYAGRIILEAKERDVGILVGGDCLTATTHVSMLMDARKAGVNTEVIHGSSIFSAAAETGLQIYKFGKTTTLVRDSGEGEITSPYEAIAENQKTGTHTLVLLDIKKDPDYFMTIREGLQILLDMEKKKHQGVIKPGTKVIAACRLGHEDSVIRYGEIRQLLKDEKISRVPAVIIVPGKLHFMEEEYLNSL